MVGHANKKARRVYPGCFEDNLRNRINGSVTLTIQATSRRVETPQSLELQWRDTYRNSAGNPTRTAQWRPVIVTSGGRVTFPPHLPGSVTRY